MYRGAVNRCVNLLVHYPEGCSANCAYCGLAKKRPGTYREKSFIHVDWPLFSIDEIIDAINGAPGYVKRTCISMITNGKCKTDTLVMTRQLTEATKLPVSILTSPTILERDFLLEARKCGADKIGVALDLATPDLFERYRGKEVSGPHRWEKYWQFMGDALSVFGPHNVGAHLMVGMGETEKEMVNLMDRLWQMGVDSHLFSFFAEEGSSLGNRPQPPWPTYLRIQLARYLIENEISNPDQMAFDEEDAIVGFGVPPERMEDHPPFGHSFHDHRLLWMKTVKWPATAPSAIVCRTCSSGIILIRPIRRKLNWFRAISSNRLPDFTKKYLTSIKPNAMKSNSGRAVSSVW